VRVDTPFVAMPHLELIHNLPSFPHWECCTLTHHCHSPKSLQIRLAFSNLTFLFTGSHNLPLSRAVKCVLRMENFPFVCHVAFINFTHDWDEKHVRSCE
jgi:hypothetical protein